MILKQKLSILSLAICLGACSSGVKLNDVPVEDKTGVPVAPGDSGSTGAATGANNTRSVAPVNLDASAADVPGANATRIIYFDYDSYVIKPEFQSAIEAHARYLKEHRASKVAVEGHTDERGGREYNLALGQKRAEAVRRALNLLGVPDTQVEAVSFGKEKPAAPGSNEDAWAKNRRDEISYR